MDADEWLKKNSFSPVAVVCSLSRCMQCTNGALSDDRPHQRPTEADTFIIILERNN